MTEYEGATSEAVADQLGIDQSSAHRRLTKTKLKGYVTNLETKPGQPGRWRATAKEMSDKSVLPTAEQVRAYMAGTENDAYAHTEPKDEEPQ